MNSLKLLFKTEYISVYPGIPGVSISTSSFKSIQLDTKGVGIFNSLCFSVVNNEKNILSIGPFSGINFFNFFI